MSVVIVFQISNHFFENAVFSTGLMRSYKLHQGIQDYYSISGNEITVARTKTESRLLGKRIIKPREKKTCDYWPFEKRRNYVDYIIGMDEHGDLIKNTSDPRELSNYFGANPGKQNYLTPIFFKKEVLHNYLSDGKYKVENGYLICGYLWRMSIDIDHRDYVMVYLGDLGRDLPESEQEHWKSYNILTDEKISKSSFMKDFMNVSTSPNIADLKFKDTYKEINTRWEEKFGWRLFIELEEGDEYNLRNLRIPLSNGQEEFDQQVLALNKVIVDSLNENRIGKEIALNEKLKGISKLEEWLKTKGYSEYESQIDFLRDLQALRSTGTGHRKGKKYQKIIVKMNLSISDKKADFEKILNKAISFLQYMGTLIER